MDDRRPLDPGRQAPHEILVTNVPGYPDTTITWFSPSPDTQHLANVGQFVRDDGTAFTFAWGRAVLRLDSIPQANLHVAARGDLGPNKVEAALESTRDGRMIRTVDAERLIARYYDMTRLQAGGVAFHQRGRRPGQKTGITPRKEREIKDFMARRKQQGETNKQIAKALNRAYPPEDFDRERWNRETVRRWLDELDIEKHRNATQIENASSRLDNEADGQE